MRRGGGGREDTAGMERHSRGGTQPISSCSRTIRDARAATKTSGSSDAPEGVRQIRNGQASLKIPVTTRDNHSRSCVMYEPKEFGLGSDRMRIHSRSA
jgi:hypothetical protein